MDMKLGMQDPHGDLSGFNI